MAGSHLTFIGLKLWLLDFTLGILLRWLQRVMVMTSELTSIDVLADRDNVAANLKDIYFG